MASSRKSFSVGDIQCIAISDGTFSYPIEWIFSNAPQEQLENSLSNHDLPFNQVVTPYTCLLAKPGTDKVLIDTGADGLVPTTGELLKHAWRNVFDLNEDRAATTRGRLLDRAAADNASVLAHHFPFPGLGRVSNIGTVWKWEAANQN